jgi:hypothetical protein
VWLDGREVDGRTVEVELTVTVEVSAGGRGVGALSEGCDVSCGLGSPSVAIRGVDLLGKVDDGVEGGVVARPEPWLEGRGARVVPAGFNIELGSKVSSGAGKRFD